MSCDKYHDLWNPFFYFFEKYWPDCPYPVYLATNSKIYKRKNILQIFSNKESTWSDETFEILTQLPHDYLIYLQDDYFLQQKVGNSKIEELFRRMVSENADYLRLFPSPGPDVDFKNDAELGMISITAPYRASLQCAIWKKETFISLLNKKESQWDFEMNAGGRSVPYLFLSVKRHSGRHIKNQNYPITYYYLTAVIRGKWRWGAARLCRNENIALDTQYRPVESFFSMLYQKFYTASPLLIKKASDFIAHKIFAGPLNKHSIL